ncbi:hypothetical protein EKO04_005511 [Ascochyta lentis]|uniref:MARVEL domain-containing protein n=1 Tax=Ascochyta lentis TaxID=205686 RepID=A0A8H7J4I8_9PLEO|nr:hypothetical protein EKO04_005511 [Ascochyta lentis]
MPKTSHSTKLRRYLTILQDNNLPAPYETSSTLNRSQLVIMAFNFLSRRSLKGEKATFGTSFWSHFTPLGFVQVFLRFFQFVLGITVIALYAIDLDNARKAGKYTDSKWVWAVVCGTLGAIMALVAMLPWVKTWFFFFVDFFIFICYLVAFGIFGKMYIPEDAEGNGGITRMKNAVWVLLTNMLLWFITAAWGGIAFWRNRNARTTHTGRANTHV